jgi:hypothetical protein
MRRQDLVAERVGKVRRRADRPVQIGDPRQRLVAIDHPVAQPHDRLVVGKQAVAEYGAFDLVDRQPTLVEQVGEAGDEPADGATLVALAVVERNVGAAQQFLGAPGIGGEGREAGRRCHQKLFSGGFDGRHDGLQHVGRDRVDGFCLMVGKDDGKLVAAQARHDALRRGAGHQPLRHGLQYVVAGLVTERVVDLLETVEIEQQQRGRFRLLPGALQVLGKNGMKARPVGHAGQKVDIGGVPQQLPRFMGGGHVLQHPRYPDRHTVDHFDLCTALHLLGPTGRGRDAGFRG